MLVSVVPAAVTPRWPPGDDKRETDPTKSVPSSVTSRSLNMCPWDKASDAFFLEAASITGTCTAVGVVAV